MATVPRACQTSPKALGINPAEREYLGHSTSTGTNNLAELGNKCTSPDAKSIESPLLESPSVATPTFQGPPALALQAPAPNFDAARINKHLSSSATESKAFLHGPETPKTLVQENHALLHLLDSKITWSESLDATMAPYQEIEPELCPTPGGWFRRWFGHSKQAAGVISEVKIELEDMPVDEFPIIPHTSGQYKPPWLSLAPNRQLGQSIVATLDFSAFDRVVDELFPPTLSNVSEKEDSN